MRLQSNLSSVCPGGVGFCHPVSRQPASRPVTAALKSRPSFRFLAEQEICAQQNQVRTHSDAQAFLSANKSPASATQMAALGRADGHRQYSHASEQSVARRQRLFPLHSAVASADPAASVLIPPGLPTTYAKS